MQSTKTTLVERGCDLFLNFIILKIWWFRWMSPRTSTRTMSSPYSLGVLLTDHVHIEVHRFLFTSLFDVDVVNGIVNLQFEYYIFELIGRVVLVDGHTPSTKASCWVFLNWVELGFTCSAVSCFQLLRFVVNVLTFMLRKCEQSCIQ